MDIHLVIYESQLKLLVVWAESSFNGLVLLHGLIWFGGKWGKMSTSLVWSGTARIRTGFGSCWVFKWLFTESAHLNFPAIGWRSYGWPSSSTSSQEHQTGFFPTELIGSRQQPTGKRCRTWLGPPHGRNRSWCSSAAWTPAEAGAAVLAASPAWASGALGSATGDDAHLNHGHKRVVSSYSLVLVRLLKQAG
jgi:hypothetical protein